MILTKTDKTTQRNTNPNCVKPAFREVCKGGGVSIAVRAPNNCKLREMNVSCNLGKRCMEEIQLLVQIRLPTELVDIVL